jgi:hypothetical protein
MGLRVLIRSSTEEHRKAKVSCLPARVHAGAAARRALCTLWQSAIAALLQLLATIASLCRARSSGGRIFLCAYESRSCYGLCPVVSF